MDILKKHPLTKLDEIIGYGNLMQAKKTVTLFKSIPIIALIGPNGCGKTTISNLIIKHNNYDVYEPYNKDTIANIDTYIKNRTIDSYVSNKLKLIFVDNIDALYAVEKKIMTTLDDSLKYKNIRILLTGNNVIAKTLTDLFKKNIEIIKINYPPTKDTFIYLTSLLDKEEVKYDADELIDIINKHRGSIRDTMINLEQTKEELSITKHNNTFKDYDIFETCRALYNKSHSREEILGIANDYNILNFILYENFPDEIYNNYTTKFITNYDKLNDYFVMGNLMENSMYKTTQFSTMYNNIQFQKLFGFNNIIDGLTKKKTVKNLQYRYSQVLSKLSHKNILNKKMETISEANHGLSTIDIIFLCDKMKSKTKKLEKEELNVFNTYHKYFGQE